MLKNFQTNALRSNTEGVLGGSPKQIDDTSYQNLIVLDELGYLPFSQDGGALLLMT